MLKGHKSYVNIFCLLRRYYFVVTELNQQKQELLLLESYFPHGTFAMQSYKNVYGFVGMCVIVSSVDIQEE
jgi:hypothetical protein